MPPEPEDQVHPLRHPHSRRLAQPLRWMSVVTRVENISGHGISVVVFLPYGTMKEDDRSSGESGTEIAIYHLGNQSVTYDEITGVHRYCISWWRFAPMPDIGLHLKSLKDKTLIAPGDIIIPIPRL